MLEMLKQRASARQAAAGGHGRRAGRLPAGRARRCTSTPRSAATSREIVHATREHHDVRLGGSPRASIALYRAVAGGGGDPRPELRRARRREAHRAVGADAPHDPAARSRLQNVSADELHCRHSGRNARADDGRVARRNGRQTAHRLRIVVMRWLIGAVALLVVAVVFNLGLFAYAMYALLGVIVVSRVLVNGWSGNLAATREMSRERLKIGDTTAVVIVLENRSWLPIPWLLVEDLLPRRALDSQSAQSAGDRPAAAARLVPRPGTHARSSYQLEVQLPRLLSARAARGRDRRRVRAVPPLPRAERAELFAGAAGGDSARRVRHRLAPADRRGADVAPAV